MPDHLKGLLVTGLGVLLVVPDSLFVRLIDAPALTVAFWRSLLSAGVIAGFVWATGGLGTYRALFRNGPKVWLYIITTGIAGPLFVIAVSLTSVANVVFIIAAMPAFAALFSWAFLRERPSRRMLVTILVVMIGIAVIALGSGESEQASLVGDLAALGVAIVFAVGLTTARNLRASSMVPAVPIAYFGAAVVLFPFAEPMAVAHGDWPFVVLHGGVFVAGATALIAIGPRYLPSAEVALLILLESVLAPILVWLVLEEAPGRWALFGGALVLGALAVSNTIALVRRGSPRQVANAAAARSRTRTDDK